MSMNPKNWSRNEQIALLLSVVVGLVAGVIVGYLVYAAAGGADGSARFGYWVEHPIRRGGLWWALTGAAIGVAVCYIGRLTSRPD